MVVKLNMYKQSEQKYRDTLTKGIQNVDSGALTKHLEKEAKAEIELERSFDNKKNSLSFIVENKETFINEIKKKYNSLGKKAKSAADKMYVSLFVNIHLKGSIFHSIIHKTFSNNTEDIYKILFTDDINNFNLTAQRPLMITINQNITNNKYKYDNNTNKRTFEKLNKELFNKDAFTNQLDPFTQPWIEYITANGFRK